MFDQLVFNYMSNITTIIGLGNIGRKYAGTRHNLGFELLNKMAESWGVKAAPTEGDFYVAEKDLDSKVIRLIWPTTYMNNSGLAAAQVVERYQLSPNELLVVYDDFVLPLGRLRIRSGGSDGGHNGISSIIYHLNTESVARLRLGVGPVSEGLDPVVFVLSPFAEKELPEKNKMLEKGVEAVLYLLKHNIAEAMSIYNPAPEEA
ncbi:Peptidyl-tRNA hydrolase [Candidatus Zixiibacteriota bacterium]|nr:Peptidyl-tRNA hydrolase [candidate division Zixibacteria bacterium]